MGRGYAYGWTIAITLGALVVAFLVRWALKVVFRVERMPRAEAFVDQWWVWAPLVAVLALVWVYAHPLVAGLASLGSLLLVRHWTRLYPALRPPRSFDP